MYNNTSNDGNCIETSVVPVYMVTTQQNPIYSNNPDYYHHQNYTPLYSNNFNNSDCNIQMLPISNDGDDTNQTLSVPETNNNDTNIKCTFRYGFVILGILFMIGCILLIFNPNNILMNKS